jgi:hypothetical protein
MKKLNLFKSKNSGKKSLAKIKLPRFGESARTDWGLIFYPAVLLCFGGAIVSALVFMSIDKAEVYNSGALPNNESTVDMELLKQTVNYYQTKELEFNSRVGGN